MELKGYFFFNAGLDVTDEEEPTTEINIYQPKRQKSVSTNQHMALQED